MGRSEPGGGGKGRAWALAAGLCVVLAACGYSFRSPVPAHLHTVYVPTFENDTREFQITQEMTERVIGEFRDQSRLQLVSRPEDADLVVHGTILDYKEEALSYDPGQRANPDVFTRRVVLTVDLRLEDRVKQETLWENPSLREWGEFDEQGGEGPDAGVQRAVQKVAEEILRNVVEEF